MFHNQCSISLFLSTHFIWKLYSKICSFLPVLYIYLVIYLYTFILFYMLHSSVISMCAENVSFMTIMSSLIMVNLFFQQFYIPFLYTSLFHGVIRSSWIILYVFFFLPQSWNLPHLLGHIVPLIR